MHENPKTHIPTVYLVVPCYNEEEVLPETVKRLTAKLQQMQQAGPFLPSPAPPPSA